MPRTLIAGNWKMNGLRADLAEIGKVAAGLPHEAGEVEILLCLPATLVHEGARQAAGTALRIGGQTCHTHEKGAFTGDVSARMLADAGASHVILGHSERRTAHGETSALVAAQARAALDAGLKVIICVGETLGEREAGNAMEVIAGQVDASLPEGVDSAFLVMAYEPVWAIGTGHVASVEQIAEAHGLIRSRLEAAFAARAADIPILYGGSMNPANAAGILAADNVNGGLIGGASLKAEDFLKICHLASAQPV